jgi:Arc/MetJ-type ribon-helix-helix transcriptional regulator
MRVPVSGWQDRNASIISPEVAMSMTSLNVSLPRSMRDFVESECEQHGYSTASEYVRALIRAAQLGRLDATSALPTGPPYTDTLAAAALGSRRREK